jgi:CHAT domain-containing protein/Tfp pilus assembly protein PilF
MPRFRKALICLGVLTAGAALGFAVLHHSRRPLPSAPPRAPERSERAVPPAQRLSFPAPTQRTVRRWLKAGTVHVYPLTVKAGNLVELIVRQEDVDLQVSVVDPGGPGFTVDSPIGSNGPERVLLVAKGATYYRVEVSGRSPGEAGPYQIWIAAERRAAERDWKEAGAEKLFYQGKEAMKAGDLHSPESKLTDAARLWALAHNRERQADALRMLGNLYRFRWEWQRSLQVQREAKVLYHQARRFVDEGKVANDMGVVYELLSDLKAARKSYEEALALGQLYQNPYVVAVALGNLGNLARWQSRSGEALENLERARAIWKDLQSVQEIKAITDIGAVFAEVGKLDLALSRFRESIKLAEQRKDSEKKAMVLVQMGHALRRADPEQAWRLYQQALRIQQQRGDLGEVAVTLNGLGLVLLNQKRYQEALDSFQKALRIYERKGSPLEQARTLTNLGRTYAGLRREEDAQAAYEGALARARGKDGWTEAAAQLGLARLEEQRRNPIAAQSRAEAAVRSVERLRAAVSPELRTSFLANRQDMYGALIEILLWRHELNPSAGYDARAFAISEQARSRGLLDDVAENPTPVSDEGSGLASRILSLPYIQQAILDPETLLLEFHLGRKASYLWLVSRGSHRVFELPPREKLESLIEEARSSLTVSARPEKLSEARRSATKLSQALLGPAVPWLGQKRLLISAPDTLQEIPFAVLPDPTVPKLLVNSRGWPKPLIVEHEIIKIPSASVLVALHARQAARTPPRDLLAILADPVFDLSDERLAGVTVAGLGSPKTALSSLFGRFKRLVHAREEAEAILAETGSLGVLAAFNFDANRALVLSGKLRNYRILHFTTHGWLQADDADLSALVLSQMDSRGRPQDGFLRAADISSLELPSDLVVLSACETGLGERILGEGLVGLPQAFMAAGATRLLVSLWRVDDLASSALMKRFYHEYLSRGRSPAAALREVQIAMWQDPRYGAPFYWGAFELQGDWRPAESPH